MPDLIAYIQLFFGQGYLNSANVFLQLFYGISTADDRGDGPVIQYPGKGKSGHTTTVLLGSFLEAGNRLKVARQPVAVGVILSLALVAEPSVLRRRPVRVMFPAKQTARHRIVNTHAHSLTSAERQQLILNTPGNQIVRWLNAIKTGQIFVIAYPQCFAELPGEVVRAPDIAYFPLEFDILKGVTPDIIHISGDVYAIAYAGDGDDGFLKTVEITSSGSITDTVIDTLEFDILKGKTPSIINVSGDVYAIAYAGDGDDGFLKTVEITSSGNITDTVIDTLEFDILKGATPDIISISGDIYAIAYAGDGDLGWVAVLCGLC